MMTERSAACRRSRVAALLGGLVGVLVVVLAGCSDTAAEQAEYEAEVKEMAFFLYVFDNESVPEGFGEFLEVNDRRYDPAAVGDFVDHVRESGAPVAAELAVYEAQARSQLEAEDE